MDAGTLEVTYFAMARHHAQSRTNWYDLRTVYEASSLSKPEPFPTPQTPGQIMDDELAQLTLEPLHLELDFPTPLNELQARLYVHFIFVWRWHFMDPITWRYNSPALNYFCMAILRLAAWDLEVSYDTDVKLPMSPHAVPPWSGPKDNIYWYHGFLVVHHDNLETQHMTRSAIHKAQQYLERTAAARQRHARLIIMSPGHIVFAEVADDDTIRASSPSLLISPMSGNRRSAGFRALCGVFTSNCWPGTTAYREIWKNYLPWELIFPILSDLGPRDMAAFAQASPAIKKLHYANIHQSIPQFASLAIVSYPLLIPCCGKRSGLEQSGVLCSVCYSWQHTGFPTTFVRSVEVVADHNNNP
ncbi:hypothetical protein AbraIFM66951_001250 [Aspergillus brasiliensis]|nr:hypothetical protein AbraIFM66951_001250 [Aspergillus brasiliensis]